MSIAEHQYSLFFFGPEMAAPVGPLDGGTRQSSSRARVFYFTLAARQTLRGRRTFFLPQTLVAAVWLSRETGTFGVCGSPSRIYSVPRRRVSHVRVPFRRYQLSYVLVC